MDPRIQLTFSLFWVWAGSGRHLWPNMSMDCTVVYSKKAALLMTSAGDVQNNLMDYLIYKNNFVLTLQKQALSKFMMFLSTPLRLRTLARKKVLLVLDDVDSLDQLDALLGNKGFHPGSKIIITTKDASLTERYAPCNPIVQPKHTMHLLEGLNETASLQLLSSHAFMCNGPKKGYEEVSKKLVKYCEGHPLALAVLGRSLRNRDVDEWEDYLEGLNKETDSQIQKVLKMSFDSLPFQNDKELFKHIACFFVGKDRVFTETILKACGIRTLRGIRNLIDRCLLTIGPRNELKMHQLLQEMGRDVIRQESLDKPEERSRLWCHEEAFNVLKQKMGNGNLKGLILDMRMLEKENLRGSFVLKTNALSKMDNLKLLQLNYVQLNGSYKNFPQELRWLCMHGFPLKYIPSNLPMENLVVLDMSYSNIESFDISYSNMQRPGKGRMSTGSCSKDKRLIGSLKILILSFCYQLHSLGGFSELPALERLILASCKSLIEISESIEQCDELALIDLSYCNKLKKLPRTMVKLKKLKELSLDGCNLGEFPIEMRDMDLSEMLNVNSIGINSQTSSPVNVEARSRDLKSFVISLPSSLVCLSLRDNNLSNESFPVDFSNLSMLEALYLDDNPIVSLPDCVRSLPKLEFLSVKGCNLNTIEHPPRTLRNLNFSQWDLLQKMVFDPEMSPLAIAPSKYSLAHSSIEIEGIVKIQPIAHVEEEVLRSLGWTNLGFIKSQEVETWHDLRRKEKSQVQMFYEFGIFSTFYGGKEVPNWISHRSRGSSLSFTIPSSPNNLRGLNFCHLQTGRDLDDGVNLLTVIISNITKNRTWIYKHYIHWVKVDEECLIWLSHWTFGKNEMEDVDKVTVTIPKEDVSDNVSTRECGMNLVYDDGNMKQDPLGYYKSWNHIIGGDLFAFQLTTDEYFLDKQRYFWWHIDHPVYHPFVANGACYKDEGVYFRAFSKRKSDEFGGAPEDVKE